MRLLGAFRVIVLEGAEAGMEVCRQLLSHKWRLLDWMHGLTPVDHVPMPRIPYLLLLGLSNLLTTTSLHVEAAKEVRYMLALLCVSWVR